MVGIDLLSTLGKATLLMGRLTVKVMSHEGWPRGWLGWMFGSKYLNQSRTNLLLCFQYISAISLGLNLVPFDPEIFISQNTHPNMH